MSASSSAAAKAATQLRIDTGIAFADLPAAMQSKIVDIIGSFDATQLSSHPNLCESFSTQLAKFEQSFRLILKAYPPTERTKSDREIQITLSRLVQTAKQKLKQLVPLQKKLEAGNLNDKNEAIDKDFERIIFNKFQQVLVDFNQGLMDLIDKNWKVEKENKEAIEALNLAEQYITLSKGRRNLATLSRFHRMGVKLDSSKEAYHVLQVEKPLNPCNKLFIKEVLAITNNDVNDVRWFQKLTEHEQVLILNHSGENTFIKLQAQLQSMISYFQQLEQLDIELYDSAFNKLDELSQQVVASILQGKNSIKVSELINVLNASISAMAANHVEIEKQSDKLKTLPKWFLSMEYYEQQLFRFTCINENIENGEDVKRVFGFLSSKHRTIPIPANFCEHQTFVFKNGKVALETKKKIRSAHGVSRDVLKQEYDVQLRHALDNYKKMVKVQIAEKIKEYEKCFGDKPKTIPVLLQTLISPLKGSGGFIPDLDLDRMKREVVDLLNGEEIDGVKVEILSINHPFNMARILMPTKADDEVCNRLLQIAYDEFYKPQIKSLSEQASELLKQTISEKDIERMFCKIKAGAESTDTRIEKLKTQLKQFLLTYELASLCDEYYKVLTSGWGTGTFLDKNGRELFLSSYEQLIMSRLGGVAYGSCVSGKDRKALEVLHSDAMEIFFALYGEWPRFDDKESISRSRFVDIFAQLYITRHQQTHAGQNSPGCDAIKTPYNYLPKDICRAINNKVGYDLTWLSDMLATNNELKRIGIQLVRNLSNLFGLLGTRSRLRKGESVLDKASWRVKSLSDSQVDDMLNQIENIVSNTLFWSEKGTKLPFWGTKTPRTVSLIQEHLCGTLPARKLLASILEKLAKPGSSMTRDEATEQFYDIGGGLVMGDSDYSIAMEALKAFQYCIYEKKPMAYASSSDAGLRENDFVKMPGM